MHTHARGPEPEFLIFINASNSGDALITLHFLMGEGHLV
jgi:hypothetical protein